jgi:hypothetical protein
MGTHSSAASETVSQLKDEECDNVLPGQGYHIVQGTMTVLEWRLAADDLR